MSSSSDSGSDEDTPFLPANAQATVDVLVNANQDPKKKQKKDTKNRVWMNDCISPQGTCIFCTEPVQAPQKLKNNETEVFTSGSYQGRVKYHLANFDNYHYAKKHADIKCLEDITTNEQRNALYLANIAAHKNKKNEATIAVEAILTCFSKKGFPDSLIEDPDFVNMIKACIENKGLPFSSVDTLIQKRSEKAAVILTDNYDLCKNRFVSLQIDVVTRCGNRFVGVTATVWNPDRSKNAAFPGGATTASFSHPTSKNIRKVTFDHPSLKAERTFLLDLRCDKQQPYSTGTAAANCYVLPPSEVATALAAELEAAFPDVVMVRRFARYANRNVVAAGSFLHNAVLDVVVACWIADRFS